MIILIDARKAFDKIQHPLMTKTLWKKIEIDRNLLNLIKCIINTLLLILYLIVKDWMLSPENQELVGKDACSYHSYPIKHIINFYVKICKILVKEFKDLNKWRDITCSWIIRINISKKCEFPPTLLPRYNVLNPVCIIEEGWWDA